MSLSQAMRPFFPRRRCSCGPKNKMMQDSIQASKIAVIMSGLQGSIFAYNKTVANKEGPAKRGMANGIIKGSPGGKFARILAGPGNKKLIAMRKRITPDAILTEVWLNSRNEKMDSPRKLNIRMAISAMAISRKITNLTLFGGMFCESVRIEEIFPMGSMIKNKVRVMVSKLKSLIRVFLCRKLLSK